MSDLNTVIKQVKAWRRRMAGQDGQQPNVLHSRAYVRRVWPMLIHEEREEVLEQVFAQKHVAADVLKFERQA